MRINLRDIDWVFLSYDEPNADANYAELLKIIPWAQRSHGVKGFDSAHLAAAAKANTEVFCTVDGDTVVNKDILNFFLVATQRQSNFAVSLNSVNAVNGLVYGNGSIKIWTREFIRNMRCHELAPTDKGERAKVDFCWNEGYYSTHGTHYSTSHVNGSEKQAWRAGYREGVKIMLDYKELGSVLKTKRSNFRRFLAWASVGADVPFGVDAMNGAIDGAFSMLEGDIESSDIADFSKMDELFEYYQRQQVGNERARLCVAREVLGDIFDIGYIHPLDAKASKFFKWYNYPIEYRVDHIDI